MKKDNHGSFSFVKISFALQSAGSYAKYLMLSNLRHSRTSSRLVPSTTRSSSQSKLDITGYRMGGQSPHIPSDPEAAALYHWTILLTLRLRLQPSTGSLARLFSSGDRSTQTNNPLSTFFALQFQSPRARSTIISGDPEVCQLLHFLAVGGHYALAIEAFSRLMKQSGNVRRGNIICPAFVRFVSCLLHAGDEREANAGWMTSFLWRMGKSNKEVVEDVGNSPGPVLAAFLGALMDGCIE